MGSCDIALQILGRWPSRVGNTLLDCRVVTGGYLPVVGISGHTQVGHDFVGLQVVAAADPVPEPVGIWHLGSLDSEVEVGIRVADDELPQDRVRKLLSVAVINCLLLA